MANEPTNGTNQQTTPAPVDKPQPKKKITTQGRKPRHRSTKAELDREALTASVITCLVGGKTIDETAKELDISRKWIERVRGGLSEDFIGYFKAAKTNHISELVEEGLRIQLESMNNLLLVTRNEAWVTAQRAPEIATLFGVINDKTVRLLAAIQRANERDRFERALESETARSIIPSGTIPRREPQDAA